MAYAPFYDQGVYVCEIVSHTIGEAKTGTPQIVIRFKVLGHKNADGGFDLTTEYERTLYMALTDKTAGWVREALDRIGYTGSSFSQIQPEHPKHVSMVGWQVDLYCQHKPNTNTGAMQESWQISKGGGVEVKPADPGKLRRLDALFGKSNVSRQTPAPRPAPRDVTQGTQIDDSDIPF